MIVVSNTTPLISLAVIGRFELLKMLFGRIHIPQAVYEETAAEGETRPGAEEVRRADWIEVKAIRAPSTVFELLDRLDRGESEAIVLTEEMNADWVLMDERAARDILDERGLRKIGTLGILLKAKALGLIPSVKTEMDTLRTRGIRITNVVYNKVLQMAGERPAE